MKKAIKTGMRTSKKILATLVAMSFLTTGSVTTFMASASMLEKANMGNGKYYTDYTTHAEALEAAKTLNEQIAEEGNVLLKNDGALPLSTRSYVSVFGRGDDALIGGYGAVSDSLINAGFNVNPLLKDFYDKDAYKSSSTGGAGFATGGGNIGTEPINFGARIENTFSLYNDAAVIVLSRNGGEGSDPSRVTREKNDDTKNVDGWEHRSLAKDKDGNAYKHYLQLTDSENAMIDYAKARCNKVIVVINTSNIMEMYNLENDPRINGILLMERPGNNGVESVGKILSGEVNPSGRTVDEWYRDFSADPSWYNFGNNAQNSATVEEKEVTSGGWRPTTSIQMVGDTSNTFSYKAVGEKSMTGITGVSYEEGIYTGYKYYETVWKEIADSNLAVKGNELVATGTEGAETGKDAADAWQKANVVYSFGHGLSYTTFEMEMGELYTDAKLENALGATPDATKFASTAAAKAEIDKLYVPVTVTNTGKVAGKQVVQIYVNAPYTQGEIEKAYVKLVGFGKTTMLQPGASETVVVSFNVQDMASFDYTDANGNSSKTWELDDGAYSVKLMNNAHDEVAEKTFTLGADAVLAADDFSGNKVEATDLSNPESEYYTILDPSVQEGKWFGGTKMTILSRADIAGTFPDKHSNNDYIIKETLLNYLQSMCGVDADRDTILKPDGTTTTLDATDARWYIEPTELAKLMAGWTQATAKNASGAIDGTTAANKVETVDGRVNGKCETLLRDMAGVPFYVEDATNGGQKVNPLWTEFMNQLTWNEIWRIITQCSQSTPAVPSIDKLGARNLDGPNSTAGMSWCDETAVASTWNTDLAHRQGIMVGNLYTLMGYTSWYGPAVNSHRSPFGGRCNEYYSSDAIQSGYMAAAAASGCESRGVNCYIKHFTVNDQETNRTNICTFVDEQNLRENYLPSFQMALQEGGASCLMMTFSRVGVIAGPANSVLLNDIVRGEWGWNGVIGTDFFPYRESAWTVGTEGQDDYYRFAGGQTTNVDYMNRNGGVHPLGNDNTGSGVWDETKTNAGGGKGNVVLTKPAATEGGQPTVFESNLQYYYTRLQAMRILYCYANSVNIDNGVIFGDNYTMRMDYVDNTRNPQPAIKTKAIEATQGVAYSVDLKATAHELGEGNVATYSIGKGELPAGLTINAETGVLAGVPNEAGTFEFTVFATVLHNHGEVDVTLTVANSLEVLGDTTIQLGEELDIEAAYEDGTITTTYYPTMEYTAEGLPAGTSISNTGVISGTPTEAGTFDVTVTLNATHGSGNNRVVDTFVWNFTVTVEEDVFDVEAAIAAIQAKLDALEAGSASTATEIASIKSDIATLKTDVSGLKNSTALSALEARVKALEDKAAEGGCNSTVSIAGVSLVILPVLAIGAALLFKKKKNQD